MIGQTRLRSALVFAVAALLVVQAACYGGDASPPELPAASDSMTSVDAGAGLLFAAGAGGLTAAEQNDILTSLGLLVSADGSELVDEACGRPVDSAVRFEDLNGDGSPEVIVDYGNLCTSGMAGTSVMLFARDGDGSLRPRLGVPGLIAEMRENESPGFPDLLIGGPGFCFGVWRWDGQRYTHLQNEPQAPGACEGAGE